MPNKWVEHVRSYAKKHGLSYGCAVSDPNCKKSYHDGKDVPPLETPMRTSRVIKATPPKPPAPAPAPAPAKTPAKKDIDEYKIGEDGSNFIYMSASQLENPITTEIFIRMLRDNDAFKSKSADTKLYNQMKKADAEQMANILWNYRDKVNYFTRRKFYNDFGSSVRNYKGELKNKI